MALLHYWSLDNADTTAGSSACLDRVGSNNLTNTNLTTGSAGFLGQSYTYNGSSNSVSHSSAFAGPSAAYSVSAWINPAALPPAGGFATIAAQRDQNALQGYSQFLYRDTGELYGTIIQDFAANYILRLSSAGLITTNNWQHCVMTWDGGTNSSNIKFYRNTVQVDTVGAVGGVFVNPNATAIDFALGCEIGSTYATTGRIDEVRYYNHVLLSSEILELYSDGLYYFFPFSEPSARLLRSRHAALYDQYYRNIEPHLGYRFSILESGDTGSFVFTSYPAKNLAQVTITEVKVYETQVTINNIVYHREYS